MMSFLHRTLQAIWYRKKLPVWAWFLWPLTGIYLMGFYFHRALIRFWFQDRSNPLPVVVVGNLTLGGVGKTSVVMALAALLKANGFQPGIITRGYKRQKKHIQFVDSSDTPYTVGDEALMLFEKTGCPVVVGANRLKALASFQGHAPVNVILSDDGLQHHALKADIEILLVDKKRGFGNGVCLPLGPLREPLSRASKVDFMLKEYEYCWQKPLCALFKSEHRALETFKNSKVHVITAIGDAEKLFLSLKKQGLVLIKHDFPDHHYFTKKQLDFLRLTPYPIITTEKDAVKLRSLNLTHLSIWVLPIEVRFNGNFTSEFLQKLQECIYVRQKAA